MTQAPLSTTALARRWGVSPTAIRAMIQRGELAALRIGRIYRIPMATIEAHERGGT